MDILTINLFVGFCTGLFVGIIIGIAAYSAGRRSTKSPTVSLTEIKNRTHALGEQRSRKSL